MGAEGNGQSRAASASCPGVDEAMLRDAYETLVKMFKLDLELLLVSGVPQHVALLAALRVSHEMDEVASGTLHLHLVDDHDYPTYERHMVENHEMTTDEAREELASLRERTKEA